MPGVRMGAAAACAVAVLAVCCSFPCPIMASDAAMLEPPAVVAGCVYPGAADGNDSLKLEILRNGNVVYTVNVPIVSGANAAGLMKQDGYRFFRAELPAEAKDDGTVSWGKAPSRAGGRPGDTLRFSFGENEIPADNLSSPPTWDNRGMLRFDIDGDGKIKDSRDPLVTASVRVIEDNRKQDAILHLDGLVIVPTGSEGVEVVFRHYGPEGIPDFERILDIDGSPGEAAASEVAEAVSDVDAFGGRWLVGSAAYGDDGSGNRRTAPYVTRGLQAVRVYRYTDGGTEEPAIVFSFRGIPDDVSAPMLGSLPIATEASGQGGLQAGKVDFVPSTLPAPAATVKQNDVFEITIDGASATASGQCDVPLLKDLEIPFSPSFRALLAGFAEDGVVEHLFAKSRIELDVRYQDQQGNTSSKSLSVPLSRCLLYRASRGGRKGWFWQVFSFLDPGSPPVEKGKLTGMSLHLESDGPVASGDIMLTIEELVFTEDIDVPSTY